MATTLFHDGNLSKIYLEVDQKSGAKKLIKKTGRSGIGYAGNAAITNEYNLLQSLSVVQLRKVLDFKQTPEGPELHLEFIEGMPLNKAFAPGSSELGVFIKAAMQIAEALAGIHQHAVIHKDINPSNIIYNPATGKISLIDFGIATKFDLKTQYLGNPEKLEGTLVYMSPEQTGRMDRRVDARSDLYSLGVTFYELLCGDKPFTGTSALEIVHAHIASIPQPLAGKKIPFSNKNENVPQALADIVFKLLEKNAENRYKSAAGLLHDLKTSLEHLETSGAIPDFELGTRDFSGVFRLSEKLYGMENEVRTLEKKYNAVQNGGNEMVLIKGYSGVGKSSLVKELHKHLIASKGIFISGKFNQLEKNIPYHALIGALNELTNYLLSESDEQLHAWKETILESLEGLGKVMLEMVPSLEQILGPQPEVPELSSVESQNRRDYALQRFLSCFASTGQPFLIFIDDLQWADEASLQLFRKLLMDREKVGFFFIGAFRNNEVSASHPLTHALDDIAKEREIDWIEIKNLQPESIVQLIADSLECALELASDLAEVVFRKTRGNAFFVIQLLKSAYNSGALFYNTTAQAWEWNAKEFEAMGITENVIDLLTKRIYRLEKESIEMLKMAACIGNPFDLGMLALITQHAPVESLQLLKPAISLGLVQPVNNESWRLILADEASASATQFVFGHDKIQQAIYELIPESERQQTHLAIGRLLLKSSTPAYINNKVFEIADHLDFGLHLITEEEEKVQVARLNLLAAKKARQSAAYEQAFFFATAAHKLLPADAHKTMYKVWLDVHNEAMENAYLSGDHEAMEEHMKLIQKHAADVLDKILVYHTQVDAYTAQNNLPKAVSAGVAALKELGVHFPENPKMLDVFKGLGTTKMKLMGKKVESLVDLPEMTDPYLLQAMPLMERISPAAFMSGSQLFPLLVFRMVDLSLKHGNSNLSAFGYASFAITLSGVLGDYDGGYRFANLSLKLLDKFNDETYRVKVYFVNYCFVRAWKEPASDMIEPLLEAYRSGMKVGNIFSGIWVSCYALIWRYYAANPLGKLHADLESYTVTFRQLKQEGAYNLANILERTIRCLVDENAGTTDLGDEALSEAELVARCEKANDKTALFFYHLNKLQLAYWFLDLGLAAHHAEKATAYLEAVLGLHYLPQFHFYNALYRLALPSRTSKDEKQINKSLKKLKVWTKHAPANYEHKYKLVLAERYRVEKKEFEARKMYDQTIALAGKNGYVQEQALSCERAAHFYEETGVTHLKNLMLHSAINLWQEWGAEKKVLQFGSQYAAVNLMKGTLSIDKTLLSGSSSALQLDKESVLKSSAILSGEINPEQLINSFMKVMIENSGADRGVLLLKENEVWVVRAMVDQNVDEVQLTETAYQHTKNTPHKLLPTSVINFTIHSKKRVLINQIEREHGFKRDQYLIITKPKALISYPLISKGELKGVLYLENKLIGGVFNQERIEMLDILSSQVAVSLENAQLYTATIALNAAYEKFVPKQFLSFLGKESILDVKLGDQVQKEMTIMFSDIRGFTTLSEKLQPKEIFGFMNDYLRVMEPIIRRQGGFIDKYIGDAIMALFPAKSDAALDAALSMVRALDEFNRTNDIAQKYPIKVGIGIHTGRMMLGTIGGEERMDSTVISDAVNIAARIESLTKEYKCSLLISESTRDYLQSPGQYTFEKVDSVLLKGKTEPVEIYKVGV